MTDNTALGDRMKAHERVTRAVLPRRTYSVLRVDGRAFHTHLRKVDKPFDERVSECMMVVARQLLEEVDGSVLAYTQSDECSLIFSDLHSLNFEPWFGGVVQKIVSVSASIASASFNKTALYFQMTDGFPLPPKPALFDSRVFTIADPVEVSNYLVWRQRDAVRNSIQMVAQHHFSHAELQGRNSNTLQEKLWTERGVNWNDVPGRHKRGQIVYRVRGEDREIRAMEAPTFNELPPLVADLLPPMPSFS